MDEDKAKYDEQIKNSKPRSGYMGIGASAKNIPAYDYEKAFTDKFNKLTPEQKAKLEKEISGSGLSREDYMTKLKEDYSKPDKADEYEKAKYSRLDNESRVKYANELLEKKKQIKEIENSDLEVKKRITEKEKNIVDLNNKIKEIKGNSLIDDLKRADIEIKIAETKKTINDLHKEEKKLNQDKIEQQAKLNELQAKIYDKLKTRDEQQGEYNRGKTEWTPEKLARLSMPGENKPYEALKITGPSTRFGMQSVMLSRQMENMQTWSQKAFLEGRPDLGKQFGKRATEIEEFLTRAGIIKQNPMVKAIAETTKAINDLHNQMLTVQVASSP
jgi:hypothetical protein